jgi:hypothetical protein
MKAHLAISLALLIVSCSHAADTDEAKRSASAEREATSKRQEILREIGKLKGHQWAGEYYAGDGLGVNTSLITAPASGYVFEWHGCLGLYDRNYGAVAWTNNRIRLSFTFENQRKGFQGIAPEFIPISWASRHYFIPADDLIGFCNDVNQGREPRDHSHGAYLLRQGDEKKAASGFPNVPEEYRQYLLAKPIEATIISVGQYTTRPSVVEWKFKDTPVTIDAGTRQGLHVGMELVVTEPRDRVESIRITKADETRSEAVMVQTGEEEPGPKVGWRLSTQAPWNIQLRKR